MTMTFSGTSGVTFPDTTLQTTAATASIPAGAKTNFLQAAAPTGWTQCTTYNNYAMRIVSGTGGGTGGSVAFTTAFASQAVAGTVSGGAVAATTLTTCQIPSHRHAMWSSDADMSTLSGFAAPTAQGVAAYRNNLGTMGYGYTNVPGGPGAGQPYMQATGGGGSHTHTFTQPSFSGTAINLAVQYVDIMIATKN